MKLIHVTIVNEVLTEAAMKKLDDLEGTEFEDLTCDAGRTREQYLDLGMAIPKDLLEKEKNFGKAQNLEDEDFEFTFSPGFFPLEEFKLCVGTHFGSTIFLHDGITLSVDDDPEEVEFEIEWCQRNAWDKLKNWWWHLKRNNFIALYFRRKKIKKQQEKTK